MFFDYDQDLATFDSLMTEIDGDTNLLEAEDEVPENDNAEEPADEVNAEDTDDGNDSGDDQERVVKGSLITSAIKTAIDPGVAGLKTANTRRNQLFRNAYQSNTRQFTIATADNIAIKDNRKAKSYYTQKDENTIIVNLSGLIRLYTPKTFDKAIQAVGDWKKLTKDTILAPFQEAINKALKKLEKIIDSGIFDVDAPENQKGYKKPKPGQSEEDKNKQSPPPDEDDNVEPPTDELENVEPPADEDQRAIYQQILKDFRETYQMQLEADCDTRKAEIAGGGNESDDPDEQSEATNVRDELVNGCYEPLMKPYADTADDDTKTKVKRVVTFYVNKYLGDTDKEKKPDAEGQGDGQGESQGEGRKSETESGPKKPGGSWYANTMSDMKSKDYHNHQLYVNPKLQGHSTAYEKYKQYLEQKKANKKADKENKKNEKKDQTAKYKQAVQQKPQPKKDEMDWS